MSEPKERLKNETVATKLIIDEPPYQFIPSLGQIFDPQKAIILQQLHWTIHHRPFIDEERLPVVWHKGFLWIRIEKWMWCDVLDGICKHLNERTFERHKSALEKANVLLTTEELNAYRDDNVKWYALNYDEIHERERVHRLEMAHLRQIRENERRYIRENFDKPWRPNIRVPEAVRHFVGAVATLAQNTLQNDGRERPDILSGRPRHYGGGGASTRRDGCRQNDGAVSDKAARHSIIEKNLDITTEIEAAPVVEKSTDFVSKEVPPTGSVNATAEVQAIADRLLALAHFYKMELDSVSAVELASRFPETYFSAGEVLTRLGQDHKLARLQEPYNGRELRKQLKRTSLIDARWRLITWPGFEESTVEFHETHFDAQGKPYGQLRCFVTKWKEQAPPPKRWLVGLISQLHGERLAEQAKEDRARATEIWAELTNGLNSDAIEVLESKLRPMVETRFYKEFDDDFHTKAQQLESARIWVLNQPNLKRQLEADLTATPTTTTPQTANAGGDLLPPERARLAGYIGEFVRLLDAGEIADENLENEIAQRKTLGSRQAAWLAEAVRLNITAEQEARLRAANDLWASFNEPQRHALEWLVRHDLTTQFPGRPVEPGSPEWTATRVRLLNNSSVLSTVMAVTEESNPEELWQIQPVEDVEQLSLEQYVGPVLQLVKEGKLFQFQIEEHLAENAPELTTAQRAEVHALVIERRWAA